MRSYMKYNTVIYGFYRAKKGIDFGKSLFVLEGICSFQTVFYTLRSTFACHSFVTTVNILLQICDDCVTAARQQN